MPVETGRSGGESTRHYKGKSTLGQLLQWDCPACGGKVEAATHPPEQGCPHCGAGVPGVAAPPAPPPASTVEPVVPEIESTPRSRPARPVDPPLGRPVERSEQVVYRLIEYRGTVEWLETTLRRSLVGAVQVGGRITATIVDDVSTRQQDLLGMASRQPGVWLGNNELARFESGRGLTGVPRTSLVVRKAGSLPAPVVVTSPVTPPKETPPMIDMPPTGPVPTNAQIEIAQHFLSILDYRGLYTLAMALNQFATVVEDESMEPEKYWRAPQCLGVANALLQLIPADWQPDQPPEAMLGSEPAPRVPDTEKD
jgi:hypothetical protein